MSRPAFAFAAAVLCAAFAGCGVNAVIKDFSEGTVDIRHVKTAPLHKRIKVLEGDAVREIQLREISKISVFPAGTRNQGGQMYYQVGILLKDGTKIGYADRAGEKWADSYLCIDGELKGKSGKGTYSIPFDRIMEIDIR